MTQTTRISIELPSEPSLRKKLEVGLSYYGNAKFYADRIEADVPDSTARYMTRYLGAFAVPFRTADGAEGEEVWDPPARGGYHSYETLNQRISDLASSSKGWVVRECLGMTHEKREIMAFSILPDTSVAKRVVLIGGHHARERVSFEIPYMIGEHFVSERLQGRSIPALQATELMIVPMLNPDGHAWLAPEDYRWNWRKNRSPQGSELGVDLNRNYPWSWGHGDGNSEPASQYYRGPRPLSELETQAVKGLFDRLRFDALISYHSYGQLILYPWASEHYMGGDPCIDALIKVAEEMAQASTAAGTRYEAAPASRFYTDVVGGELGDWAMRTYGIDALTVELPPDGEPGFLLRATDLRSAFAAHLPALLKFLEWVSSK